MSNNKKTLKRLKTIVFASREKEVDHNNTKSRCTPFRLLFHPLRGQVTLCMSIFWYLF